MSNGVEQKRLRKAVWLATRCVLVPANSISRLLCRGYLLHTSFSSLGRFCKARRTSFIGKSVSLCFMQSGYCGSSISWALCSWNQTSNTLMHTVWPQ